MGLPQVGVTGLLGHTIEGGSRGFRQVGCNLWACKSQQKLLGGEWSGYFWCVCSTVGLQVITKVIGWRMEWLFLVCVQYFNVQLI